MVAAAVLSAAALLIVVIPKTSALAQRPQPAAYGAGANSCGDWLKHRKDAVHTSHEQWILGYLTGLQDEGMVMAKTDAAAATAWMDKFCAEHPQDTILQAARAFSIAIEVRR